LAFQLRGEEYWQAHTMVDKNMNSTEKSLTILYFGNHWFAENRTSSHQIARQLAKHHRVHYFQCPGLRAPGGSRRDLKKILTKIWAFLRGGQSVPEGLTVRTLLQLPLHRFGLVRWLNRIIVKATVRTVMWREGIRRPISWFHIPHLPYLVNDLNERLAVYYCIDDYSALPGVNVVAVQAMDDETTRRADVTFIASDTLLARKRELTSSTYVSPHGVDIEHFARARDKSLSVPTEVANLSGKVIGFFGLIEKWIDLRLIDYLAEQRPDWTFVMIGRVAVPQNDLPVRSNVQFLGVRPYDVLPDYGRRFDAAILPYVLNRQVFNCNPLKLREYLAMGTPIVSVDTPHVRKFAEVVEIAQTREDFLSKLDTVLSQPPSPEAVARRTNYVASSGWDSRVADVLKTIQQHLDEPDTSSRTSQQNEPLPLQAASV
jgi:glycosyltransferase involved in cell wall biosynthesis